MNYLDAARFTELFRHRRKNHAQIFLGMRELVAGVARKFWFRTAEDREEVEAEALVFAVERLEKFRLEIGNDAFSYFTSVIYHFILRYVREAEKDSAQTRCFSQIGMPPLNGRPGRFTRSADEMFGSAKPYSKAI